MGWKKITLSEYFAWYSADHKVVNTKVGQDAKGPYLEVELDGPCKLKHRARASMDMRKDFEFWIYYQHSEEEV